MIVSANCVVGDVSYVSTFDNLPDLDSLFQKSSFKLRQYTYVAY